jgi:hypothetical protein
MPAPEGRRDGQPPGGKPAAEDPLEGLFYEPNVNQRQYEPMPASHDDELWQDAVQQNEAFAHAYETEAAREGQGDVPADLTPGPEDPRTAPTYITGAERDGSRVRKVRRVSRAVRGRPDGEVDPRA